MSGLWHTKEFMTHEKRWRAVHVQYIFNHQCNTGFNIRHIILHLIISLIKDFVTLKICFKLYRFTCSDSLSLEWFLNWDDSPEKSSILRLIFFASSNSSSKKALKRKLWFSWRSKRISLEWIATMYGCKKYFFTFRLSGYIPLRSHIFCLFLKLGTEIEWTDFLWWYQTSVCILSLIQESSIYTV